jgi:hypothetical protein
MSRRFLHMRFSIFLIAVIIGLSSCGIYSMRGIDTSGASNFSVDFFRPQTPLAPNELSQLFTESLKDILLTQSPLDIVDEDGELEFEGSITGYKVQPVSVQSDETASLNRLTITVKVKYTNNLITSKSFERNFSKYTDFDSQQDLLSVQSTLWEEINDQLVQEIYNASLGNW